MARKTKHKIKVQSRTQIQKKYRGSGIALDLLPEEQLRIPSRFLAVNHLIGGGLPYGRPVELFGQESAGKTALALDFAYATQQLGGIVLIADAEHSMSRHWAELNDLDLSKLELYQETGIEYISDWAAEMGIYYRSKLTHNEPILLIVDSIATLTCVDNSNESQAEASAKFGKKAAALSEMLNLRSELFYDLGITSIFINQLRDNVGAGKFEDPDKTPGGRAMAFYAAIRLGLYRGKTIKGKIRGREQSVGNLVSIRVKKNKVAPPRKTIKGAEFYNNPDYHKVGFDKYFGLPELLLELDVVQLKKGGTYIYKDKTLIRGEENFRKLLVEDEDLRKKLLRRGDINTIGRFGKKLETLKTNLYPVDVDNTNVDSQLASDEE